MGLVTDMAEIDPPAEPGNIDLEPAALIGSKMRRRSCLPLGIASCKVHEVTHWYEGLIFPKQFMETGIN